MRTLRMLGLVALVTAPLAAQQPSQPDTGRPPMMRHRMMGPGVMGQEMMEPMMRGMAFAPDHLLGRKDALELTPQQVTRLTAIRDAAKAAHDAAHAEHRTHMEAMAQAMKAAAPDTTGIKQHFQAAHAAGGKAHWAMLSAAAQARALLTDVQRGRVEGWTDAMMMRRQMMQRRQPRPEEHHPDRP